MESRKRKGDRTRGAVGPQKRVRSGEEVDVTAGDMASVGWLRTDH